MVLYAPPTVYAPREDSELLADAARRFSSGRVLDLGCGTGIAGIAASKSPKTTAVAFADVNPDALAAAKANAKKNGVRVACDFIQTDLFSDIKGTFDTILFNPPYVPTAEAERTGGLLEKALDGGPDGREVLDRFLEQFGNHLAKGGLLLLLNSSCSAPEGKDGNAMTRKLLEKMGFSVALVAKADFFFEHLVVFAAQKD